MHDGFGPEMWEVNLLSAWGLLLFSPFTVFVKSGGFRGFGNPYAIFLVTCANNANLRPLNAAYLHF